MNIKSMNVDCSACGKCCDFESFGHKLFITSPELLYFRTNIKPSKENQGPSDSAGCLGLAPAPVAGVQSRERKRAVTLEICKQVSQICPYLKNGKCTARDFRFAGCRIFFCKADSEKINELSEQAIKKFKTLCDEFDFPYRYVDLATALNNISSVNPRKSVSKNSVNRCLKNI
ncbi:MAG: hypothetical protein Q8N81_01555 [bacterium]|nr:hypothetical protein [bacterium]